MFLEDVPGANIVFQHQEFLDLRFSVKTGADGTVMVNDIPEGRYVYNISATGHVPYSGTFVVQPGLTTTVPIALEVTLIDIEWSVSEVVIQDRYEITIKQTFQTQVPAPVVVVEPPNVNLPPMEPGQVFQGEFTVTNYGLIEVYDVALNFPRTIGDYDIEVMADAVPDKIGAMQTVTVPYRITRRTQTASAATNLFDEVRGYGGDSPCPAKVLIGLAYKYVVCPNSAFERVANKAVSFLITLLDYTRVCTGGTGGGFGGGTGGGSWYGGGGGGGYQLGSGASIRGSWPSVIAMVGQPCCDKVDGYDLKDGRICVNGDPVTPKEGDDCKEGYPEIDLSDTDCRKLVCAVQEDETFKYTAFADGDDNPGECKSCGGSPDVGGSFIVNASGTVMDDGRICVDGEPHESSCQTDTECDLGIPCIIGTCNAGICAWTNDTSEQCTEEPPECTVNADCPTIDDPCFYYYCDADAGCVLTNVGTEECQGAEPPPEPEPEPEPECTVDTDCPASTDPCFVSGCAANGACTFTNIGTEECQYAEPPGEPGGGGDGGGVPEYTINITTPTNTVMDISAVPEMPSPTFHAIANIPGVDESAIQYDWSLVIKFKQDGRSESHTHTITKSITGSNEWKPDWGNTFAGGNVHVYVSIFVDDVVTRIVQDDQDGYTIRGTNPSQAQIFNIADNIEKQAVCWAESSHRQFDATRYTGIGMPLPSFGHDGGYGLMMLTISTEEQVWNWESQLQDGIAYLVLLHGQAQTYLNYCYGIDMNDGDPTTNWAWDPKDAQYSDRVWNETFARYGPKAVGKEGRFLYYPDGNSGNENCTEGNCEYAHKIRAIINNPQW